MRSEKQINITWYVVIDLLMAALAWGLFYFVRKWLLNEAIADNGRLQINYKFWLGIGLVPAGWLALYTLVGTYNSLYKKSRLLEFTMTFVCSLIGCIVLFFAVILDDIRNTYSYYYLAFLFLFAIHFILTITGRLILLNIAKKQLLTGKVFFKTLMVGSQDNAIRIYKQTAKSLQDGGYRYVGFLTPDIAGKNGIHKFIPRLGTIEQLEKNNR